MSDKNTEDNDAEETVDTNTKNLIDLPPLYTNPVRPSYLKNFMIEPLSNPVPFRENAGGIGDQEKSPVWLISFTDLMALMLTFFVMTFSMSVPDEQKWPMLEGTLNAEFNTFEGPKNFEGGQQVITLPRATYNRALNLDYLSALLTTKLQENRFLQDVNVIRQDDRLLLSLPNDLLFEAGNATISSQGRQAIDALVPALNRIKNAIEIAGHADPRPVSSTSGFVSNWHLSMERARSVGRELKRRGYERPLQIEGFSSARFEEMSRDLPEEERLEKSRRVDIVLLGDDGKLKKEFKLRLEEQSAQ